jgi:segregation and condensation protein B
MTHNDNHSSSTSESGMSDNDVNESAAPDIAASVLDERRLQQILEGALLAAGKPLPLERLESLFLENERPEKAALETALAVIMENCAGRGFELKKVASGYRFQVRQEFGQWIGRLWDEKPQR